MKQMPGTYKLLLALLFSLWVVSLSTYVYPAYLDKSDLNVSYGCLKTADKEDSIDCPKKRVNLPDSPLIIDDIQFEQRSQGRKKDLGNGTNVETVRRTRSRLILKTARPEPSPLYWFWTGDLHSFFLTGCLHIGVAQESVYATAEKDKDEPDGTSVGVISTPFG